MKNILFCLIVLLCAHATHAQVGINTNTPDQSAALDITSDNSGILIPRMTKAQRDAITTPATGLMIYQIDGTSGFYYYDGSEWKPFTGEKHWTASGNNIYNANNGNVGIGTSTPTANFHIQAQGGTPTVLMEQGFETDMDGFTVTGSTNRNWARHYSAADAHTGNYSMRTGSQTRRTDITTLNYTVTIPAEGAVINFYYKLENMFSPENGLTFYVNGVERGSWNGDIGWTKISLPLIAGTYPLKWEFKRPGDVGTNLPFAYVDDILIETAVDGAFRLVDGSEGLGKVLLSDASGNASWHQLNNEIIIDIPLIAAFGGMQIPICNDIIEGSTGSFQIPIKGIQTTVSWNIIKRETSENSMVNAISNIDFDPGNRNPYRAPSLIPTTTPVLKAYLDAERLQVQYNFNPPLPFEPRGFIFSANNNSNFPDTFTLNYARKSQSSVTINITRNDRFGHEEPGLECWTGEFFFDVFMTN